MLRLFTFIGLFWAASAVTVHDVQVGDINGTTQFFPEAISAQAGDIVTFHFAQKNHSVVQSSFADPCGQTSGGFNSGFMPVPPGQTTDLPTYNITVNDDKPIWVYCGQKNPVSHCGLGMVFAVNCGPDGSTTSFSAFKAAAIAEGSSESTSAYPSSSSAPSAPVSPPNTETDSSSTGTVGGGNVIKVTVGENSTLTYNPPFVTAQIGDIIEFEFRSKNHTATQSTFGSPCSKLNNATTGQTGFDSDFQPVVSGSATFPTFNITVNDTAPIWVYCKRLKFYLEKNPISHCAAGMVFAINANESSSKSYEAFLTLAKQTNTSDPASTPSSVSGDVSGPANGGNTPKALHWLGLLAVVGLTVLAH